MNAVEIVAYFVDGRMPGTYLTIDSLVHLKAQGNKTQTRINEMSVELKEALIFEVNSVYSGAYALMNLLSSNASIDVMVDQYAEMGIMAPNPKELPKYVVRHGIVDEVLGSNGGLMREIIDKSKRACDPYGCVCPAGLQESRTHFDVFLGAILKSKAKLRSAKIKMSLLVTLLDEHIEQLGFVYEEAVAVRGRDDKLTEWFNKFESDQPLLRKQSLVSLCACFTALGDGTMVEECEPSADSEGSGSDSADEGVIQSHKGGRVKREDGTCTWCKDRTEVSKHFGPETCDKCNRRYRRALREYIEGQPCTCGGKSAKKRCALCTIMEAERIGMQRANYKPRTIAKKGT
ncbi:unnamed protein product, partial [Mesorhabditis spiculigera]